MSKGYINIIHKVLLTMLITAIQFIRLQRYELKTGVTGPHELKTI